jgi:hypothetical protein
MIYVPLLGEKESLKSILASQPIVLGLYREQVVPDDNTIIGTLTELPTGGGRGYAPIELTKDLLESGAAVADKWTLSTDSNGKALGTYDNANQVWTFNAVDVADGYTAYGLFGYFWVLPFDAGAIEIKPGDVVEGATSGATGIVTSVLVYTGSWGAGTAAGDLRIMTKTGTFQDGENITISGAVATATIDAAGTGYAVGDIFTITQEGAAGAKLVVTAVDAYGGITDFVVVDGGMGYSADTGLATVALTGSGNDDATIDIATLAATVYAVTNTGATADAIQKLLFVDAFTTPQPITPAGFQVSYPMALTLSTAT